MSEKKRAKFQEGMAEILEPGETVKAAVWGNSTIPILWVFVGIVSIILLLPVLFIQLFSARQAVITDRNIYVTKARPMSTYKPAEVIAKHPLGAVTAIHQTGANPQLVIGNEKIYLNWNRTFKEAAATIAAGGQQAPAPAIEPAT
jgi:hypothetical protein